jgi:hypothetical protein
MPLDFKKLNELFRQKCASLSIAPTNYWLYVSIAEQKLWLMAGQTAIRSCVCSTSKNQPSCIADSLGTPTGLHAIGEKIGGDAQPGAVFKGRVCVAEHFSQLSAAEQSGNLITTRILRLKGLEPDHNGRPKDNAWERFVYLHGTNHQEKLGQRFSAGCVLLGDDDIIPLYETLEMDDLVWIDG